MKTALILIPTLTLFLVAAAHASVTEKFSQTCPLNGDGSVSLSNVNGPVEIVAWDKSEVSIEAVKEASDEAGLRRIQIMVESTPARLTIKTEHENSWKIWGTFQSSVRYTLRVPARSRLDKINTVNANITVAGVHGSVNLDTVNGSIKATGLTADAQLESVNGSLSAEFASLEKVFEVKIKSVNGAAEVTLPKGAGARIKTSSLNGHTNVEPNIKLSDSGYRGVTGEIGTGGPSITLGTVNGSIAVREK